MRGLRALQWQDHLHSQCTTTLHGKIKETQKDVNTIHRQLQIVLANPPRSLVSFGMDHKTYTDKPDGSWDQTAENMMNNFSESEQYFVPPVPLRENQLRSKVGCKKSIHYNGSDENIELLLRTVISANQLSVYGAADPCNELSEGSGASGKVEAPDHLETMETPTGLCRNSYQCTAAVKLGAIIRTKIRTLVRRPEIIQTMLWCGFEAFRKRTILLCSWYRRSAGDATFYAENTQCLETRRRLVNDGFSRTRESVQSWT